MLSEKEILGIILRNPKSIEDFLLSGYFDSKTNKRLELIKKIWDKKGEIISDELSNKVFGIDINNYSEVDLDVAYDSLIEWNKGRFLLELNDLDFDESDIDKLKEKYKFDYDIKEKTHTLFTSKNDIDKIYQQFKETVDEVVSSGYKEFNNYINEYGGWMKKGLYCIMGLSGLGKSIFLTNFARSSFELKQKVLYISTEMTEPEINERFFKSLTNQKTFEKAAFIIKQGKEQYTNHLFQVIKINPYEYRVKDLKEIIENLTYKPDIIYIDYADELLPDIKIEKEYDAQGHIYAKLKGMANDNNIPIVTATQTNRSAAGEKGGSNSYVGMRDVADSSKKVRLLDGLYSIIQEPGDKELGQILLQVVKARKAPTGFTIPFNINYETMKITEGIKLNKPTEQSKKTYQKYIDDNKKTLNGMNSSLDTFEEKLNDPINIAVEKYKAIKQKRRKNE